MKTIKVTYTETYIVTEERIVEVSNATFKKLQNEDSEEYERLIGRNERRDVCNRIANGTRPNIHGHRVGYRKRYRTAPISFIHLDF